VKLIKNKYFVLTISFILLLLTTSIILKFFNNKKVDSVKDFINGDIKILYSYKENKIGSYLDELCNNYELTCMQIDVSEYNKIEKKQLKELINNDNLNSTISVFNSGKLVETVIEIDSEEKTLGFLQRVKIMPTILNTKQTIINDVNTILNQKEEKTLLYLVYDSKINTEKQENIIQAISNENNINYKKMNTYLLSAPQKNKLNNLLKISDVSEQIIVCISNGTIIGNIRDVWNSKYKYLSQLKEIGFITTDNFYNKIDKDEFEKLISNSETQVITITSDDCKYCSELAKIMDNIIVNYNIEINNLHINLNEESETKSIQKTLEKLEFDKELTTPLTLIVQKDEILEIIIGSSNEETIINLFEEYRIIKKEKEKTNE